MGYLRYLTIALFFSAATFILPLKASSSAPLRVVSPDASVEVVFHLGAEQEPVYSVRFQGKRVVEESPLALDFRQGGAWGKGQKIVSIHHTSHDETYSIVAGKSNHARDHYNQMTIALQESSGHARRIDLQFRAYNDGAAFRYFIPDQPQLRQFELVAERSEFRFKASHTCWAAQYGSFTTAYEKKYDEIPLDSITPGAIIGLPITIALGGSETAAITEANLLDYAGMYLEGVPDRPHALVTRLSPLPKGGGVAVRAKAPHYTPWRVLMLGRKPGDLIESNIVLNLSDPCALSDTSWIKPGKAVFPWWVAFKAEPPIPSSMTTENQKYYIDSAAQVGAKYLEFEPPWYGDEKQCIKKPDAQDITKPLPTLNMPEILAYGRQHNVDLILWVHWKSLLNQMDAALPLYEKWGAKGVKVDFMQRDDQEMVNYYTEVAQKCARHHLMVDFHGAYKPTGLCRTYPNVITREGVMGAEHNKVSARIPPCTM